MLYQNETRKNNSLFIRRIIKVFQRFFNYKFIKGGKFYSINLSSFISAGMLSFIVILLLNSSTIYGQTTDYIQLKPHEMSIFKLGDFSFTEIESTDSEDAEIIDHPIKVLSLSGNISANSGHIYEVTAIIQSDDANDLNDVPIYFILFDSTDYGDGKVRQYYAGTYIIPSLLQGTNSYNFRIIIPPISNTGTYKLQGLIYTTEIASYAMGLITDQNIINQITNRITNSRIDLNINFSYRNTANLRVWDFQLKDNVGVIFSQTTDFLVFNGDITLVSLANNLSNSTLTFYLKSQNNQLNIPLQIFNSQNNNYYSNITIPQLVSYIAQSVSITLKVSGNNFATLADYVDTIADLYIVVVVNNPNEAGQFLNDNTLNYPVTIVNDLGTKGGCIDNNIIQHFFEKIFSSDYISAGISLDFNGYLEDTKVLANGNVKIPMNICGLSFNLIEIDGNAKMDYLNPALTNDPTQGLTVDLSIIDQHIKSQHIPPTISWSDRIWQPEPYGYGFSQQFLIVIVPVVVTIRCDVIAGVDAFFYINGAEHKIGAGIGPAWDAFLTASVAVGTEAFSGGIEGSINLFHYDVRYALYMDPVIRLKTGETITVYDPLNITVPITVLNIICPMVFEGTTTLNAGSGAISVFVRGDLPYLKWGFVPWCCKTYEFKKKLFGWDPLWQKSWKFMEYYYNTTYTPETGNTPGGGTSTINEDGTPCNPAPCVVNSCIKCCIQPCP